MGTCDIFIHLIETSEDYRRALLYREKQNGARSHVLFSQDAVCPLCFIAGSRSVGAEKDEGWEGKIRMP